MASYLAGFIDGEGYIGIIKDERRINRRRIDSYTAVIKVANTDENIIRWLKDSFGGTIYKRMMKEKQNDAYCWTLEGKKLLPFLEKVSPYLKIKKRQSEVIKFFRKTYSPNSYEYIQREAKNGGKFISKTLKKEVLSKREELYKQLKAINKKGKSLHAKRLSGETPKGDAIV